MTTGKTLCIALATLAFACGGMLLSSTSASAVIVHRYEREVNGSETPAGTFRPFGVAVDNSTGASAGDVYVADPGDGVLDRFGALGEYQSQMTGFSTPLGARAVAVDNSTGLSGEGVVYAADQGEGKLYKAGSLFATGLAGASGVAVDQSTGDVYVTRGESSEAGANTRVYRFSSSGAPLPSFEGFTRADAVAVDATGEVYVLDAVGVVKKLDSSGKPLLQWSVSVKGLGGSIAVDQSSGHVYVAGEEEAGGPRVGVVEEFSSSGALLGTISEHSPKYPARSDRLGPVSVAVDAASGDVYAGDVANRVVDVFGPDVEAPEAFTGSFSSLLSASVTLEGMVNPKGNDATSFFEYGPCAGVTCSAGDPYVSKVSTVQSPSGPSPGSADDGSGTVNVPVQAAVTGLSTVPNQPYHYRLFAENTEIGMSPPGGEGEFHTLAVPPLAESLAPVLVGYHTAVLTGSVNPQNSETTYRFQYGACETVSACPASPYTNMTPTQTSSVYGSVSTFQEIEGLAPSSAYHYRLIAENQACPEGETHPCRVAGAEEVASTEPAPALLVTSSGASGVTQTAAVISGTVNPNGLQSVYGFQIGTQAGAYGPEVGTGRIELGVYEPRTVALALQGLQPGVTYHYRLLASNAYTAIVYGADQTFTTAGAHASFTQPLAPPLLAVPVIAFPAEAKPVMVRALTRSQKLANALRACNRKPRRQRAACAKQAHKKYGAVKKKK